VSKNLQKNRLDHGIVRVRAGSKGEMEGEDGGEAKLPRRWASLRARGVLTGVQDSLRGNSNDNQMI